jgi:hypothetical protein
MATPCLCSQAESAPTCAIDDGPGIILTGTNPVVISTQSAQAWTAYTPTLTNFTLGNDINASRYMLNGKTLDVVVALRFGTTSTFTSTEWQISLPAGVTPFFDVNLIYVGHSRGEASMKDASAGSPWFEGDVFLSNTGGALRVRFGDDSAGIATTAGVKQGTPFTWTTSDELTLKARLEVV